MPYLCRRSTMRGKCRASFCHLAEGQPVMSSCLGCLFFCCLGVALTWLSTAAVVPPCAACRASKTVMAAGHPFMGRGSRRRWGNPEGVPRSQTALRRFVLRRRSSYPRFLALQLQAIFIGKKKLEAPYRFRGGAISREKGVRFHVDNRPRGGAIYRSGGVRFIVEKLAYPQGFSTGRACLGTSQKTENKVR